MPVFSYRSICVPLDGSPFAEQAMPLAMEVARRSEAILQIAFVHHPVPALATALEVPAIEAQLDQEARGRERAYLGSLVERVRKSVTAPVTEVVLDGPVSDALETHIENSGTDLVVMSTHGRGPMSRFWLGSVADQLMRRLHIPLLLVRPSQPAAPPTSIRRILVTLDGSPFAERAIDAAVALGRPFGAEYALLMVVEPPLPIADPSGLMVVPVAVDAEKQLREAAANYLEGVAARLRKEGLTVTTHPVEAPAAAATIIEQADALRVDLIAIASHGAGGITRLVVGSVADKVIRGSAHPTLVVRPTGATR
ncbi:MAG TPA: universal stress protein [Gemmatimonadales bacterium]|jgi:nucleotide-binding universal stress UspA family protein